MTFHQAWGERLRERRTDRGLSLVKLSRLADVDPSMLSKIERGLVGMSDETKIRLATALDIDPNELWRFPSEVA